MFKLSRKSKNRLYNTLRDVYGYATAPIAIFYLASSTKVHPAYNMTWPKRMWLGVRFMLNYARITHGTSWRAHLVMAMKLLEYGPDVKGDVVECGCWKGGSTVNLSLICKIVGRRLRVYDSFEGLPPPAEGDPAAALSFKNGFVPGVYGGTQEEVMGNVRRLGAIEVCEFNKGWFENTLPHHEGAIVMAFWDVDLFSSLHDCLQNLWEWVIDGGAVFTDEYTEIPFCSVFYSEKYWSKYFDCAPPGLVGIGTGVQVGFHYTDPWIPFLAPKLQTPQSVAYTVKGTRALWEYYPDEFSEQEGEAEEAAASSQSN